MKKIMLATDGSNVAEHAARFLAHLPHDEKLELTIVSAIHVPGNHGIYLVGDWIQTCKAEERKAADDSYSRIESVFAGANVSIRHYVCEGHPGETIVGFANEIKPELLVIGATGRSAISRLLLGSTSDYVATHAPCSVLVVRPPQPRENPDQLRVAIAYEPGDPARAAVAEFSEFSWAGRTDMRVVSVVPEPGCYGVPYNVPTPKFVELAADQLREVIPKVSGEIFHCDHVGEGLVRYLQLKDIDLVVVGESPRSRLGRVLLGSVTRFVLRHARCSVWITRNRVMREITEPTAHTESVTTGPN